MNVELVLAACAALATVVVFLFKHLMGALKEAKAEARERDKATQAKLVQCQTGHAEQQKQMISLAEKVGRLEGQGEGVKYLAEKVLSKIDRARQ